MNKSNNKINQTTNALLTLFTKYALEFGNMDEGCYKLRLIPYSIENGEIEGIYWPDLNDSHFIDVVDRNGKVLRTYNAKYCVEAFENNVINPPDTSINIAN